MKIRELKPGMGKVDIEVEVVSVGEVKTFEKFGRQGTVAVTVVKDDSGEIKMTVWNEMVDKVSPGTKVKITNGYVNEFQGEPQLTAGKFGKLEIVGEGAEPAEKTEEKKEVKKKKKEVKEETKEEKVK